MVQGTSPVAEFSGKLRTRVRVLLLFARMAKWQTMWIFILMWCFAAGLGAAEPVPQGRVFQFSTSGVSRYRVELPESKGAGLQSASSSGNTGWIKAWPENGGSTFVEFGSRLVLELKEPGDPTPVLKGFSLAIARRINDRMFVLASGDTLAALSAAEELSRDVRVAACYPVARKQAKRHEPYARRPRDPYFYREGLPAAQWQWHLENRDTNGTPLGIDLNVRAAWVISQGAGITLAIADDGFEVDHPDLKRRALGAPHFNFHTASETDVGPSGRLADHATAVAGLAAASSDTPTGVSGVAPAAQLASWVLFDARESLPDDEVLMDMFQYKSNVVSVQNHSWGKVGPDQLRVSKLEQIGISNAVRFGRQGKGVVIVRSGGNGHEGANNANDDEYPSNPSVIAVAAARYDGRAASYSNPGACILVATPSGDNDSVDTPCIGPTPALFTTDRQGVAGYNSLTGDGDLANYGFDSTGFSGTSASAPQLSGLAALILSANGSLTYRDVQQVLLHSARHYDRTDPDLRVNGAGYLVSHNLGFGIPDAGAAVHLAQSWVSCPSLETVRYSSTIATDIPDLGLRVMVQGADVPENLLSIPAISGGGLHPDSETATLPLIDVGGAREPIATDLTGKAALILRGTSFFCEKLTFAAQAGARFSIVRNHKDANVRVVMGGVDFVTIPAVMISQNDGDALRQYLESTPGASVRLKSESARYQFNVSETLICEHVGLRVDSDHTRRGDLRITLVSPVGTRSVMQNPNGDAAAGPVNWTYYSTHHFYESSAGTWLVEITDEDSKGTGSIKSLELIINGISIVDKDTDGLDDAWEMKYFGTLSSGQKDDPDNDGVPNAREQALGSNPMVDEAVFQADLSVWDNRLARLSWPGRTNETYQIRTGIDSTAPLSTLTNILGKFPITEWFVPYKDLDNRYFRLQSSRGKH